VIIGCIEDSGVVESILDHGREGLARSRQSGRQPVSTGLG